MSGAQVQREGKARPFLASRTRLLGLAVVLLAMLSFFYAISDAVWLYSDYSISTPVYMAVEAFVGAMLLIIGIMVVATDR